MLKSRPQYAKLLFLLLVAGLVKLASVNAAWVEKHYTYGLYPTIAKIQRRLLGWLPFSFGDLLYAAAALYFAYLAVKSIVFLKKNKVTQSALAYFLYKTVTLALLVYILFNALWGLNYSRKGIAYQLGLQVAPYNLQDVVTLADTLQQRLNAYAAQIDTTKREALYKTGYLIKTGMAAYSQAEKTFPYLHYALPSFKPSLYTGIGHFIGFTGYYNPFSGEAQLKTTIPIFIKPFVTAHEMAHQLGYAKENEANFVAFLSSRHSQDANFLYSVYYELYRYAIRDVYYRDSALALSFKDRLHPQVRRDNEALKAYFISTENSIEPLFAAFYDRYLKLNNQQKGVQTYNEVVALLIAYSKKYGLQSI